MPDESARSPRAPTDARPSAVNPAAAGPRGAAAWVEQYGDLVYDLAVRLTRDREEARDLAQDAFVLILKGAPSFRGDSSPRTWICRVVINCHRNRSRWWRRLKRGRTVSLEDRLSSSSDDDRTVGSTLADPGPLADRIAEANQTRRWMESALGRLPADQREALILREVEELSYAEIAEAVGVAEGTVRSRLSRGRDALRRAMIDREGPGQGGTV